MRKLTLLIPLAHMRRNLSLCKRPHRALQLPLFFRQSKHFLLLKLITNAYTCITCTHTLAHRKEGSCRTGLLRGGRAFARLFNFSSRPGDRGPGRWPGTSSAEQREAHKRPPLQDKVYPPRSGRSPRRRPVRQDKASKSDPKPAPDPPQYPQHPRSPPTPASTHP